MRFSAIKLTDHTGAGFDDIYAHWPRADGSGVPRELVDHGLDRQTPPPAPLTTGESRA
jgi:hypothetical protein